MIVNDSVILFGITLILLSVIVNRYNENNTCNHQTLLLYWGMDLCLVGLIYFSIIIFGEKCDDLLHRRQNRGHMEEDHDA